MEREKKKAKNTHVEIERDTNDRQQPQDTIKQADVSMKPFLRLRSFLSERLQQEIKDVN
jgi:hypothetical protein